MKLRNVLSSTPMKKPIHFTHLKCANNGENLWVHFWVTQDLHFLQGVNLINQAITPPKQNMELIKFKSQLHF